MLTAALRDLQWRRRRFVIAIVGTALVFAMTLVLTGLSNGFGVEAGRTVREMRVDGWVVRDGAAGPFLGASPMLADVADTVARAPGVLAAAPIVYARKSVGRASPRDVNVFGSPPGGPGVPAADDGHPPRHDGDAMVSTRLGYHVGDSMVLSGRTFRVVGRVRNSTAVAGVPNVFLTLHDAQAVAYSGQPIATAIATRGFPRGPLPNLVAMRPSQARSDLLRPLEQPRSAITFVAVLLWIVAGTIIGSVVYLSALERVRDFAVFKAVGVSTASILGGLALQAVVLSVAAAVVGGVVSLLLAPSFPMTVVVPGTAFVLLPLLAVAVGLVASLVGMRRVVRVDPALAFGGP